MNPPEVVTFTLIYMACILTLIYKTRAAIRCAAAAAIELAKAMIFAAVFFGALFLIAVMISAWRYH